MDQDYPIDHVPQSAGGFAAVTEAVPSAEMRVASAETAIVGTFASMGTQSCNWSRFAKNAKTAFFAGLIAFMIGNTIMRFAGIIGGLAYRGPLKRHEKNFRFQNEGGSFYLFPKVQRVMADISARGGATWGSPFLFRRGGEHGQRPAFGLLQIRPVRVAQGGVKIFNAGRGPLIPRIVPEQSFIPGADRGGHLPLAVKAA